MNNRKKVFHCNVELAIDLIKGKWTPLILCYIGNSGILRYGELKRGIPNINERVLSRQLRELEEHHLINRKVYDERPMKVEYSLSETGKTLLPILNELGKWSKKYNTDNNYGDVDQQHGCENEDTRC